MPLDRFEQKNIPPVFEQQEISLSKEEDLKNLEDRLQPLLGDEAAEQCVLVLRSMADDDFGIRCHDATHEFGQRLAASFGEEESFFKLAPFANFSDVKSYSPLTKMAGPDKYHSVGMLELKPPERKAFSLAFDLNYRNVSGSPKKDAISFFYTPGTREQALKMLKNHYGGSWRVDYEFNPENGRFVSG